VVADCCLLWQRGLRFRRTEAGAAAGSAPADVAVCLGSDRLIIGGLLPSRRGHCWFASVDPGPIMAPVCPNSCSRPQSITTH
jgi:hypothetical protein